MSQVEASKVVGYATLGPPQGSVTASKVVAYLILQPGSVEPGAQGQGHCHVQIIRRSR